VRQLAKEAAAPFVWPVQRLRGLAADEPVFSVLLLVVLLGCAYRAIRGDRLAALFLVPLSFGWVLFNGPLEGPVLFSVSWSHGVTMSDLISVMCLFIAAWRLAPVLLRR
jgi:Na+-transporting methylmalonyl-CoA/oxaloacetate decarboxylase beta subunit